MYRAGGPKNEGIVSVSTGQHRFRFAIHHVESNCSSAILANSASILSSSSGKISASVESQRSFAASTNCPASSDVNALVSDPRWKRSSIITGNFSRTPTAEALSKQLTSLWITRSLSKRRSRSIRSAMRACFVEGPELPVNHQRDAFSALRLSGL